MSHAPTESGPTVAVLNIRVDDHVRDRLKDAADAAGRTLSEHVRVLLLEAVVPIRDEEGSEWEEAAPESMRLIDRQVLALLHRILARVLPAESNDVDGDKEHQLERAEVLEAGFVGEYWLESAGFRPELSRLDCRRVIDILQMFRLITYSLHRLADEGQSVGSGLAESLQFEGFDFNDPLEHHMAEYVRHQMGDGRWEELKPQVEAHDGGNSHSPRLDLYLRMLAEHRRIMDGRPPGHGRFDYLLSHEELAQIAEARIHPSYRKADR